MLDSTQPDVVINCIGVVKQLAEATDPLVALPINSLLPHRLARHCEAGGARLLHVSTDCVFSGKKGMYTEADPCDADDLYGRSKLLGEVDYPNAVTLRTSIIGHELAGATPFQRARQWVLADGQAVNKDCHFFLATLGDRATEPLSTDGFARWAPQDAALDLMAEDASRWAVSVALCAHAIVAGLSS